MSITFLPFIACLVLAVAFFIWWMGRGERKVSEWVTMADINAPPEKVWQILTDPAGYANWNPEIIAMSGTMAAGQQIKASVKIGGGAMRTVQLRVTEFEPPTRMEWTGGMPFGLFIGRRLLTVSPRNGGTEFRMHLHMSGPMLPMILKSVGDCQPEIDSFSAGLKKWAEKAN